MCDYCDCRQLRPIAELSEEHERLLALSARIRAALGSPDKGCAAALLDELLAILEPHARREEEGLFVALARDEDLRGVVPALLADHAVLHRPGDGSEAGIVRFLDTLAAHIDREEHDVFPAALQILPASAWSEVLERSARPLHVLGSAGKVRQ